MSIEKTIADLTASVEKLSGAIEALAKAGPTGGAVVHPTENVIDDAKLKENAAINNAAAEATRQKAADRVAANLEKNRADAAAKKAEAEKAEAEKAEAEKAEAEKAEAEKAEAEKAEAEKAEAEKAAEADDITFDQLTKKMLDTVTVHGKAAVLAIMKARFNIAKLSELDEAEYSAMSAALDELNEEG